MEELAENTFCIFLLTPSLAQWLTYDSSFLTEALQKVYLRALGGHANHTIHTIHALCAVVDRLPAGRALKPGASLEDECIRRTNEPPVGEAGYEGLAFAILPATASLPSSSPKSTDKGAIDFILPSETTEKNPHTDTWRLPLANTVFQTGAPTTMQLSRWRLVPKTGFLGLEMKTYVSHHGVQLTPIDRPAVQPLSALSVPLLPLTKPRQVEGCMGNIIRRIVGPRKEIVTASSELERVVPQFFHARGEPPQPVTAWALVLPASLKESLIRRTKDMLKRHGRELEGESEDVAGAWGRLWRSNPTEWDDLIPWALSKGARLHRVLSGGGGWGKKAGLLSLDPVPVSEEVPIRMEDATSDFDGPGSFSDALTPVVEDGDSIQFFVSPTTSPEASSAELDGLLKLKQATKERAWGWELGTIPSTVDSIPGGSWQHTGPASDNCQVFKHSFGALAEGGMTLTRRHQLGPGRSQSTILTTMIDVPYSRFWTLELEKWQGSANDVGEQKR